MHARLRSFVRLFVAVVIVAGLAKFASAQPPLPKPGPEHAKLEQLVGTWDCVANDGQNDSKGTIVYKMELGGLWLGSDFNLGEGEFRGKGLDTYDALKKKYISVWCDSMSTTPLVFEGEYDQAGKVLTMVAEGRLPTGDKAKFTSVTTHIDKDTHYFSLKMAGDDGKDMQLIKIKYTRRK